MTAARVALYGGSFDPPHLGHVLSVSWALAASDVDAVWVIPTWKHPFEKAHAATFEQRVEMCELAFSQFRDVRILTIERDLGAVSHTLVTIEALEERHPESSYRLLIGADVLGDTQRWHRWDEIVRKAPPLVVGREGYPRPESCPIVIPNVSSTDARAQLGSSGDVTGWIPHAVVAYIETHDLYRDDA